MGKEEDRMERIRSRMYRMRRSKGNQDTDLPPRLLPRLLRKQGRPQARQEPDPSQAGNTDDTDLFLGEEEDRRERMRKRMGGSRTAPTGGGGGYGYRPRVEGIAEAEGLFLSHDNSV